MAYYSSNWPIHWNTLRAQGKHPRALIPHYPKLMSTVAVDAATFSV